MWLRVAAVAAILSAGFAMEGCTSIRQATGAVKQPPDEFTVLTKAPLVLPPDYNLRPPQPGVASRNEIDPDQQAQQALFQPSSAEQAAMLGPSYSDGEKLLLTKSNALTVDPDIRRMITTDAGQEDQGPAFSQKVLYEGAMPAPGAATANPKAVGQPAAAPATADNPGFFGRVFKRRTDETPPPAPAAAPAPQPQPVVVPMPAPAPAASVNPPPASPPAAVQKASAPAQQEGWFARNFGIGSAKAETAPVPQPAVQVQAAPAPAPQVEPAPQAEPAPEVTAPPPPAEPAPAQ